MIDGGEAPRPIVYVTRNLTKVVDETSKALGAAPVYQRQGKLADVVRDATCGPDEIVRPKGTPRIRYLPKPRLHEVVEQHVDFCKRTKKDGKWEEKQVHVPPRVVPTLEARGEWAHIRPLAGIATYPVLRPDGSLLTRPGYDYQTGLIYEADVTVTVPSRPTQKDATNAIETLLDPLQDFPFEQDAHSSTLLAALLTILARPAIDGPTPLFLLDANERGSGKTLLADFLGMIATGKSLPRRTACESPEEWKKVLLAIGIAADPVILIDNVTKMLRSDALDAVLTGTQYRERLLGKNEDVTVDIKTVFLATANNATLSADIVRRCVHVRLECESERPAEREGFKYPHLLDHVRKHRSELLSAALTVLRAYVVAEKPKQELRPMGSYEAWSAIVRGALVWAGLPDPAATQVGLQDGADPEGDTLELLLPAWEAVHGSNAVTVRDLLSDLKGPETEDHGNSRFTDDQLALRDAIGVLCDTMPGAMPSARRLGNRLRHLRGRVRRGRIIEAGKKLETGIPWNVRKVSPR